MMEGAGSGKLFALWQAEQQKNTPFQVTALCPSPTRSHLLTTEPAMVLLIFLLLRQNTSHIQFNRGKFYFSSRW